MASLQEERIRVAARISVIAASAIAVTVGMSLAKSFLAPTFLAFVVGIVLSPVTDFWDRIGAPRTVGALLSLLLTLFVILAVASLTLPVMTQIGEAWPTIRGEMSATMAQLQTAFSGIESAGEEMQEAIGGAAQEADAATDGMSIPSTTEALFLAPAVAGQTITFAGVLFFFVLTRREIYGWVARRLTPEGSEEGTAMRLLRAERQVARYFLTIAIVNLGFGAAVTLALYLIGMPSFYLWGVATTLLNFVLYLGPAILFVALGVAGLVVFDGAYAMLPALAFLSLNMIEAQFVTPTAVGRSLSLNPLLVFVALVFFLWLWGPIGGFIAIPLVLWIIVLANIEDDGAPVEDVAEDPAT